MSAFEVLEIHVTVEKLQTSLCLISTSSGRGDTICLVTKVIKWGC